MFGYHPLATEERLCLNISMHSGLSHTNQSYMQPLCPSRKKSSSIPTISSLHDSHAG